MLFIAILVATPIPAFENAAAISVAEGRNSWTLHPGMVRIRGIITGFSGWQSSFFLQDSSGAAISVDRREGTRVQIGEEVEVHGTLQAGLYAPVLLSDEIEVISQRRLPTPIQVDFLELAEPSVDSKYVEVSGVLHAVHREAMWGRQFLRLDLKMRGGMIPLYVQTVPEGDLPNWVDSTVHVRGVCGTIFDRQRFIGARLFVSGLEQIEIIRKGKRIDELPLSPVSILGSFAGPRPDHRIKVSGVVTYQVDTAEFYLQDHETAIRVQSSTQGKWSPGQRVTAAGFLNTATFPYTLSAAVVQVSGSSMPVLPVKVSAQDVIRTANGFASAPFNGRLIELRGRIVDLLPTGQGKLWRLGTGSVEFDAQLPDGAYAWGLERDSDVVLKGICLLDDTKEGQPQSFRILLRSSDDIRTANIPYGSTSLLLLVAILLFVLVGASVLWFLNKRRHLRKTSHRAEDDLSRWPHQLLSIARVLGSVNVLVGSVVIVGWIRDISSLELGDGHTRMMPNAAVGILMAGMSVCLINSTGVAAYIRRASASLCGLVGLVSLFEDATGIDLGIDQVLIHNLGHVGGYLAPGRMATATSLCLGLLSLPLLFSGRKRPIVGIGQVVALAAGVIALLNMLANVYGSYARFGVGAHATMALPTAVAIVSLSLAVLFASSGHGFMRTIVSSQSGGLLTRRLIPLVMVLPIFLGWIRLQGQIAGLYDTRFGLALFTLSNIVCFGFVVWNCAAVLNSLDRARADAEQEARERDRNLKNILQTALVGDWTWDVEKDEVSAHPVVWALYGAPDHVGNEPASWFKQRLHPDDVESIVAVVQAAFEGQKCFEIEFRAVQPNGSIRWICCRGDAVSDSTGKWIRSSGINLDITDRKQAELCLKDSEEQFRQLADAMPQIVWTATSAGESDYYNQRCYDYLGMTLAETRDGGWVSMIHPDEVQDVMDRRAQAFALREPYTLEYRFRRASDGMYRWHLGRGIPVRNPAGDLLRWIGTCTDIHSVKLSEAALRSSELQFRQLANAMPQIVWTATPDGNVDYYNQRWYDYTGMNFEQTKNWGWQPVVHPDDIQNCLDKWTHAFTTCEPYEVEYRFRRASDGLYRWYLGRASAVRDVEGTVVRWFGTSTDIEDFKRAEIEIRVLNERLEARVQERTAELDRTNLQLARANEELKDSYLRLEQSNHELQDFASVASHDLQEPLRKVQAFGDRLKIVYGAAMDKEGRDYLDRMLNATKRMQSLIQDLLTFARVSSQGLPFVPVDLARVAREVLSDLELRVVETNAQVEVGDLPTLYADPVQMRQLLQNLIGNALKFHQKGKPPAVRVYSETSLRGRAEFRLIVEDKGIGFDQKYLDRIFTMFQRLHARSEYEGTGVGLAVCRKIALRHGGHITAASMPGHGASFLVTLPFRRGNETALGIPGAMVDMNLRIVSAVESETSR